MSLHIHAEKGDDFFMAKKKLTFVVAASSHGKSSVEVVDQLVSQTINKVLIQSQELRYNQNKKTS